MFPKPRSQWNVLFVLSCDLFVHRLQSEFRGERPDGETVAVLGCTYSVLLIVRNRTVVETRGVWDETN